MYTRGFQPFLNFSSNYNVETEVVPPLQFCEPGERCKPLSGVWGGAPGAKHILREINAKTSINHSLTGPRFSDKDIMQKLEYCM